MQEYNHKKIERKWQKEWEKKKIYRSSEKSKSPKYYVLDMFPYPSGEGLHVGHPKGYIATDVISRMKRMQGYNVLHPMGFDAFGLPAENYALKMKVHPEVAVKKNIKRFKDQLGLIGLDYDWSREVVTTDPKYYRWTQWIFLQLYKKGLVYESHEPINWCPSCKTGLANEDLEGGNCERCGTQVEKKPMRQWVIKITDYADKLLADLDLKKSDGSPLLAWPESIKEMQRNWIGRSEGMLFSAPVKDTDMVVETFSAHFEAFRADTFVVIAPDHPLLKKLIKGTPKEQEVLEFAEKLTKERLTVGYDNKESKGIFTERYIVDPVGNGDLPIWVASYALAEYGTGIVKCSAHDERDFAFAKKYKIRLKPVLFPPEENMRKQVEDLEVCFTDMKNGVLLEPQEFEGKKSGDIRKGIITYLENNKLAKKKTTYKLRDWVFSRQRYWGEPIPLIHCDECGVVAVPEGDLPVLLPKVKSYEPTGTGESPLAGISKWVNVKCPTCGGQGRRETNTMPQWAGSSWYYLRYMDPKNTKTFVDKKKEKYWNMVDLYVGGAEHATRHLIYARFWHKFLYDIGAVSTREPFGGLESVGLIAGPDGRKMSKRFGNVINPDDIVSTYGADTLRIYEMFMGPFNQSIAWSDEAIIGPRRFLERVWKMGLQIEKNPDGVTPPSAWTLPERDFSLSEEALLKKISSRVTRFTAQTGTLATQKSSLQKLARQLHKTIKKVEEDIQSLHFNTAISAMMILLSEMERVDREHGGVSKDDFAVFLRLLAPFAPHITQELWQGLGQKKSIHLTPWPKWDKKLIVDDRVKIVIQVNSKTKAEIMIDIDEAEENVKNMALTEGRILTYLKGQNPKRVVYVKNRLINIVV